jgi:phospholipase C
LGPLDTGGENVTACRSKKLAATRDLRISPDRADNNRHACLEPKHRNRPIFAAVDNGDLPSLSYVKPDGLIDGHPASSNLDLFEGMVENIYNHLRANPDLMETTAFIITFDEGGGYYDSGYIQPVDFFGDGPRIPLIVVSPFTKGGHISHTYADHVSILKFIERNWHLKPLTNRSRDNFPNPVSAHDNPYVPLNSPALGDLFDLFHFDQHDDH